MLQKPKPNPKTGQADITAAHAKANLRPRNADYGNIAALGKVLYPQMAGWPGSCLFSKNLEVRQISPLPKYY